jgi:hypothetical protein
VSHDAQSPTFNWLRFCVMHHSLSGYLIAIAMGGVSLLVKSVYPDLNWLSSGLLLLAFLIALLATLGFGHDKGWLSSAAYFLRRSRRRTPLPKVAMKSFGDASPSQMVPSARAPRPAGPAGPVPVLERQPKDATGDAIDTVGVPTAGRPKMPSDD